MRILHSSERIKSNPERETYWGAGMGGMEYSISGSVSFVMGDIDLYDRVVPNGGGIGAIPTAPVAQSAEAKDLKSFQCRFESDRGYSMSFLDTFLAEHISLLRELAKEAEDHAARLQSAASKLEAVRHQLKKVNEE